MKFCSCIGHEQYIYVTHYVHTVFASVVDLMPPSIVGCPEDISATTTPNRVSTTVTWDPPSASDDSGQIANFFNNFNPGDVFPLGTTEVVYIWTDPSGNSATCSFNVVVIVGKSVI